MRTSSYIARWLIVFGAILALPVTGYAQEAVLSGTVTDSMGLVVPGVTVTALHQASGNTFVAVTDERGAYRLSVRIGFYEVTVSLPGFSSITRSVELLVGQQAVMNFEISPSAVQESVTVTGEPPLIDTSRSSLGSNIDSRQMESLPLTWSQVDGSGHAGGRQQAGRVQQVAVV